MSGRHKIYTKLKGIWKKIQKFVKKTIIYLPYSKPNSESITAYYDTDGGYS